MKPRKPSKRRKGDRRAVFGEYKIEGENGKEKIYFKREKTGDKWIEDSRKEDRRKGARRKDYIETRRLGFEEYPKIDIGDRPSLRKKYFRVPEHVYEEQLKNQKGIIVTSKKLNRKENYVEMFNRRVSKEPGKRAKDKERKK
ncbi:MAG TPA: hypothetical protein ENH90_00615 [bacterium]|nr:hypothetical protein [bacterium]